MNEERTFGKKRTEPTEEAEWEMIARDDPLLSVRNLQTGFETESGMIRAVDGVSFEIDSGEIVGLVGESGSGKSVTSLSIMQLLGSAGRILGGGVEFDGENLFAMSDEQIRELRGDRMSMIFQEPASALNPVFNVGWQVGEPLRVHRDLSEAASRERAVELMRDVGIPSPETRVDDYPHQFSGGMQQRAMIAMALACDPDLLIADEPTTGLDVSIEAAILDLIRDLNASLGMAVLLITHDLSVVAQLCDRVAVMYAGRIVEYGPVERIFDEPRHPYTKGLLGSILDPRTKQQSLSTIGGEPPDPQALPAGCHYFDRCPYATEECESTDPRLREVGADHYSACIWENP